MTATFEEILDELESGNDVKLAKFGVFEVKEKKERPGRNPKTKEACLIAARKVVAFHPCKELAKSINKNQRK